MRKQRAEPLRRDAVYIRAVPEALPDPEHQAEVRPLPVLAEPRPIERRVEVSLPAAVAAATGGFLLGVATFLMVRVLRRPRPVALRLGRTRRQEGRRRGHALVPRRHPPPEGPIATTLEQDVVPLGPYRLPGPGRDGVMVARDGALTRALWVGEEQVVVRAWGAGRAVRIRAEAETRDAAAFAIERMRFALGTDHDLSDFHRRFRWDPLIGPVIRRRPWLRPRRRPEPFEALAWAVCEQLIESGRAAAIERRIVRRHGRRSRVRHAARAAVGRRAGGPLAG